MDVALNSHGQLIRAEHAPRGGRYQCPECKVRVLLNRGTERVAHFKHWPSSDSEQIRCERCTLYLSDDSFQQTPVLPKPRVRAPAKALLSVGWKETADGPERWSLYVSVPLPPNGVEQVLIEGNINGEIWLNRRVVERQRHIPVRAVAKQYACLHRPKVVTSDGYYNVQPTDVLELDRANIFAAGTNGGAQLERKAPLVRGRCYFALSKKPDIWETPPRMNSSLVIPGSRDCDPHDAWQGYLFHVPMCHDRRFDAWCQRVCKRSVVPPPDDFELLYPPLIDTRPDGTLVVPHGEPLIFALSGQWSQPEIEIWRDDIASNTRVERLRVIDGERVSITNLPEGLFSIYAMENHRVLVRIEVAIPVEPTISAFSIRTVDLVTGEDLRGDLHHEDGSIRWSGLMSGDECCGEIDFPKGWPVKFRYRLRNEKQDRSQLVITSTELARLIAECLALDPSSASVDAGILGKANWEAPKLAGPSQPLPKNVPHQLRDRIDWLLANYGVQKEERVLPLGIVPPSGWDARLAPRDFDVFAKFFKSTRWPVSLLTHARSAAKDLCDNLKN